MNVWITADMWADYVRRSHDVDHVGPAVPVRVNGDADFLITADEMRRYEKLLTVAHTWDHEERLEQDPAYREGFEAGTALRVESLREPGDVAVTDSRE